MPDDKESISVEDVMTEEEKKRLDEAHEEAKEKEQPSEGD